MGAESRTTGFETMQTIQPGGTIGVFGGGQLGRMFATAAKQMSYKVIVYAPEADSPAAQVADEHIIANYSDQEAVSKFADAVDAATIEFENIPVVALEQLGQRVPVRPGAEVLRRIQNRLDEKTFLSEHGFPVAEFRSIRNQQDATSVDAGTFPAVLKTSASGYDGKGQRLVKVADELKQAWHELGESECVLESFVDFELEFSVIVARNDRETVNYAPIRNDHQNHILDISSSPSLLPTDVCDEAVKVARGVTDALGYIGVLCVEFFLRRDGAVVINEIAPRPHNSGHLTIEAHATSQFEQQVRAVCNLPLGSTKQLAPAAMANLLGDLWTNGVPDWSKVVAADATSLHLYGKEAPRVGRKMGHITSLSETVDAAISCVDGARNACSTVHNVGDSESSSSKVASC